MTHTCQHCTHCNSRLAHHADCRGTGHSSSADQSMKERLTVLRSKAHTLRPSSEALSAETSTKAAAPSASIDEFPAVMVPPSFTKAAGRLCNLSGFTCEDIQTSRLRFLLFWSCYLLQRQQVGCAACQASAMPDKQKGQPKSKTVFLETSYIQDYICGRVVIVSACISS